ncbi:hypothetical protein TrispH2_001115 [Trichoplax sp. H2]|nr:hypothetical protein TrispH2_001115 [Trichoplax sp. H2]|eukprot:RDD46854.1 hypothetical protein TrispH2_001115 [Trichoplax sp. H2]
MAMSQNSNANDNLLRWNKFKPSEMSHSVRITNAMEDFVLDRQLSLLKKEQQAYLLRSEEDRRYLVARAHNNHYLRRKSQRKSHYDIHNDVKLPKLKSKGNYGDSKSNKNKTSANDVHLPQLSSNHNLQQSDDNDSQISESSSTRMRRWQSRRKQPIQQNDDNDANNQDHDASKHPQHKVEFMHPPTSTNMEIRRQSLAFNRVEVDPNNIILPTNRRQKHMMTSDLTGRRASLLPLLTEIEKQNLERFQQSMQAKQNRDNEGFANKLDELFPELNEDESHDRHNNNNIDHPVLNNDTSKDNPKKPSAFQSSTLKLRLHQNRKHPLENENLPKLYEEIRNCNYIRNFRTGHNNKYRHRKRQTQWLKY